MFVCVPASQPANRFRMSFICHSVQHTIYLSEIRYLKATRQNLPLHYDIKRSNRVCLKMFNKIECELCGFHIVNARNVVIFFVFLFLLKNKAVFFLQQKEKKTRIMWLFYTSKVLGAIINSRLCCKKRFVCECVFPKWPIVYWSGCTAELQRRQCAEFTRFKRSFGRIICAYCWGNVKFAFSSAKKFVCNFLSGFVIKSHFNSSLICVDAKCRRIRWKIGYGHVKKGVKIDVKTELFEKRY